MHCGTPTSITAAGLWVWRCNSWVLRAQGVHSFDSTVWIKSFTSTISTSLLEPRKERWTSAILEVACRLHIPAAWQIKGASVHQLLIRAKRLYLCLSRGYQSSLRWMLAFCRPSLRLLQEVAVEAKPSDKETHNTTVVFTFIALLVTLRLYRISICYDLIVL